MSDGQSAAVGGQVERRVGRRPAVWVEPQHLAEQCGRATKAGYGMVVVTNTDRLDGKVPLYAETDIAALENDCMTLALRLFGEDPDTFAPETREVMDRWRTKCMALLAGE